MKWIEAGDIKYTPAIVARDSIIHIHDDGFTVDQREYQQESPRRWYFLVSNPNGYTLQVVSMAYHSGWDSWDSNGEALRKYNAGEVSVLLETELEEFDYENWNGEWNWSLT